MQFFAVFRERVDTVRYRRDPATATACDYASRPVSHSRSTRISLTNRSITPGIFCSSDSSGLTTTSAGENQSYGSGTGSGFSWCRLQSHNISRSSERLAAYSGTAARFVSSHGSARRS